MNGKSFRAEFLAASALHLLCLAWVFHAPLLRGQVDSLQGRADLTQAATGMSEMVYITQPILSSQAKFLKEGLFPAWTPLSQGGTPLIGKMQGGIFSPYHIPLHVLPLSWLPYAFSLVVALKIYLAFAFAYLFGRCLRLDFFPAFLCGTLFVFSHLILGKIFTWSGGGLYLPLVLLLTELCFHERRKAAQFLLPWAVAFSFFSGHFESAFRINFVAGLYFLCRLRQEPAQPSGVKLNALLVFAGLMLLGVAIAAVQIAPAIEYNNLSYNKVWHTPKWFNILEHEIIGKHLSGEDVPLLSLGFGAAGLFAYFLRRSLRATARAMGAKTGAALALALAIAALANLGLDDSLIQLTFLPGADGIAQWLLGLSLAVFSFWAWRQEDQHPGVRIIGGILIGSLLVINKLPLLANAILHAPMISNFHNTTYRWEFNLALAVLGAAAWQKISRSLQLPWRQRLAAARGFFSFFCIFLFGYLAAQPLKEAVALLVPTSTISSRQAGSPEAAGGIMGPEFPITFSRHWTLAGWLPADPPPASVVIHLLQGNQVVSSLPAQLSPTASGRLYFHARLPLPESAVTWAMARVSYGGQPERILRGPEINSQKRQWGRRGDVLLLAGLLLLPVFFLAGGWGLKLGYALALAAAVWPAGLEGIGANQIPYALPGIAKIKEDRGLFRVSSLNYNFLQADYANMYGLSDFRGGGDALDVLTEIYFSQIYNGFLADPKAPPFETGLRLLGLANVKYLLDAPGKTPAHAGLETFYQGADMTIFKNKYFSPRALFYDQFAEMPLGNWRDWGSRGRFLGPIAGWMTQQKPDFEKILLLNDSPRGFNPAAAETRPPARIDVAEYSPDKIVLNVETPRPGFVFLSDNFFPGWEAVLNGRKAKILRSWITFRAVEVPGGKSSLVFLYRPLLLRLGALLSAVLALAWAFFYRRFLLQRGPPDAAPAHPQKNKKASAPDSGQQAAAAAAGSCAATAQAVFLTLIGACMLYWSCWSAFVYRGNALVSWTARALLAVAGIVLAMDIKNGRYKTARPA